MQNVAKRWSKLLIFLKGSILGCILLLIIISCYMSYALVKHGKCMVTHRIIMSALKDHISSGKQMPESLPELARLKFGEGLQRHYLSDIISFGMERHDLKYYPDAWNKPGRIILRSRVLGSYVVTFGNGSLAVLSYWYSGPEEKEQDDASFGREEHRLHAPSVYGTMPVLMLFVFLLASFFSIVIVERIIKKKIAKEQMEGT